MKSMLLYNEIMKYAKHEGCRTIDSMFIHRWIRCAYVRVSYRDIREGIEFVLKEGYTIKQLLEFINQTKLLDLRDKDIYIDCDIWTSDERFLTTDDDDEEDYGLYDDDFDFYDHRLKDATWRMKEIPDTCRMVRFQMKNNVSVFWQIVGFLRDNDINIDTKTIRGELWYVVSKNDFCVLKLNFPNEIVGGHNI